MELLKVLNERYATKKMNGAIVPEEKVEAIVEAARLAPTSSGLQPFKVIVITNKELKEKIVPIAFNQSQVADCFQHECLQQFEQCLVCHHQSARLHVLLDARRWQDSKQLWSFQRRLWYFPL